ncbi:proline-specific peptidase [Gymnopus androsaceus JB14]|uniref:Proline-specific peptidase n=1 Tax=Gymnopus androsaceus JB14 TaxID=1447944 RepID=A0A6A4IRS5_9AGAR|nr:proline-specific peptidase [Gymnopus androsaceus JB14]
MTALAPFTISFNGVPAETWYTVFGDLESTNQVPLIVAHGGAATHHYLTSLSQLTTEYSIPIVLYDQLGFGLSSHFPAEAGNAEFWTVDLFVEQLKGLVKYLKIADRYDFMGHSFGTVMGLEISSAQQNLSSGMRKQVLYSPAASVELLNDMMEVRREKAPKEIREALNKHETEGTTDSEEYQKAEWPNELLESMSYRGKDGDALHTLFGDNPRKLTGSLKGWSSVETAHNIGVPTLLLNGQYDWVKWVKFSNSSHLLHFEEKERFVKQVGAWLTEQD